MLEFIKTIAYAFLIAIVVRTLAFEPFSIPSGSMIPTLLVGDYLFVSKYSYGYSIYSLSRYGPKISGRLFNSPPVRGDVAVFRLPTDMSHDYIKRIIGLPGDRIQVKKGVLHINDTPVQRRRIDDYVARADGVTRRVPRYIETLPGGREHEILEYSDADPMDNTNVYSVPEGHVFAMGDNRDRSLDSRYLDQVGFIPIEYLVGRAQFMFFSINGGQRGWFFGDSIRFERLFQGIT